MSAIFATGVERVSLGKHRSITAADKLASIEVTLDKDDETAGALAAAAHYAVVVPGNRYGSATPQTAPATKTPTASKSLTLSMPRCKGATHHDIYFSADAAPKHLIRIAEANRIAGCKIVDSDAGADVVPAIAAGGSAGTKQVVEIQVTHKADSAGLLTLSVTSKLIGTVDVDFAVAKDDTAAQVAEKAVAALAADKTIASEFKPSVKINSTDTIVLTALYADTNDTTLAIALSNDGDTGVTVGTSTNTTAGVAGVCQVETATVEGTIETAGKGKVTVTSALLGGDSPLDVDIPGLEEGDDAEDIAEKIRAALTANTKIAAHYAVGGDGATYTLTALVAAANDDTLNMAHSDGDGEGACVGITPAASSANTTGGVAPEKQVETITVSTPCTQKGTITFRVSWTGAEGTENTDVAVPLDPDIHKTADIVATEIRGRLNATAAIAARYAVGGEGAAITLTRLVAEANDAALAMALQADGSTGVTVGSSAITTQGVAPAVTLTIVGSGLTSSADPVKVNNAYDIDGIDPVVVENGKTKADITIDFKATDLSVAPSFKWIPFLYNEALGDYVPGDVQEMKISTAVGETLRQHKVIDLNGAKRFKIACESIAGNGAQADIYADAM